MEADGHRMGSAPTTGPLSGVRVLDLTDALAAYGGRLLADLGADVLRVEPAVSRGSCEHRPFWLSSGTRPVSLFERFVNAGKRSITLDLAAAETARTTADLLASGDIVLESPTSVLERSGWYERRVREINDALIRIRVTPYGGEFDGAADTAGSDLQHGAAGDAVDDLVLLGAGGLLHLGGYPDAGPVAAYGEQSTYMASIFTAVAAIAGLVGRARTGEPVAADVSAQECVAQALEESVVGYALTGEVRAPQGDVPKEAGTGVYRCADGFVSMVAGRLGTAAAWASLLEWITQDEPEIGAELRDERWSRFEYRQRADAIETFQRVFERFAATRTRQELYREAQARGIALSPVNDFASVLDDRQLRERSFFADVDDPEVGQTLTYPGLPYRMSGTPLAGPRPAPRRGADNVDVLVKEAGLDLDGLESLAERGVV